MAVAAPTRDSAILSRIIGPEKPDLPPEAAEAVLSLRFEQADLDRMNELAANARAGTVRAEEQDEIDSYERIGHFLSLLKSKARLSLRQSEQGVYPPS